jgi:hypothetical protein
MKWFLYFFAETETLWSQGPVTWNFWKSYSIRPRYSTLKHFQPAMKSIPQMLSQRWNSFGVCSVCDEIRSAYDQHVFTCKNCSHFTAGWASAKIRSSYAQCVGWNPFRVCSACYNFLKLLKNPKLKCNFKILAKIEGKEAKFVSENLPGA